MSREAYEDTLRQQEGFEESWLNKVEGRYLNPEIEEDWQKWKEVFVMIYLSQQANNFVH